MFTDIFNTSLQKSLIPVCFNALEHLVEWRDIVTCYTVVYLIKLCLQHSGSVFIIPSKMILKLRDLALATPICNWVMYFLAGRTEVN